ncbi:MAG: hypothetical protein ABI432_12845 [Flavobacteriales bacterium]
MNASAQAPRWAKALGGVGGDFGMAVVADASGAAYITGIINGVVDMTPDAIGGELGVGGSSSMVVSKYNNEGAYQWGFAIPGAEGRDIAMDGAGNLYVTGAFTGRVDMDPSTATHYIEAGGTDHDVLVAKYSGLGAFVWEHHYHYDGNSYGTSLALAAGPLIYACARTTTPTTTAHTLYKFNAGGDILWGRAMKGNTPLSFWDIATDPDGDLFVAGLADEKNQFDPEPLGLRLTGTEPSNFIATYRPDGSLRRLAQFAGANNVFTTIAWKRDHLYLAGLVNRSIDIDPGPATQVLSCVSGEPSKAFLAQYDDDGMLQWAFALHSAYAPGGIDASNLPEDLGVDDEGNIYVTGTYDGVCDFDPDPALTAEHTSFGIQDYYLASYGPAGALRWVSWGSEGMERDFGLHLAITGRDGLFACGKFNSARMDLDPTAASLDIANHGLYDMFLVRYAGTGATRTDIHGFDRTPFLPRGLVLWGGGALLLLATTLLMVRRKRRKG